MEQLNDKSEHLNDKSEHYSPERFEFFNPQNHKKQIGQPFLHEMM